MVTVRVRVGWGQRRTPLGKMSVTRRGVCSIVAVLLHEVCVLLGAVLFFPDAIISTSLYIMFDPE